VELTLKDAVTIAILEDMPIYFDENMCKKNEISISQRLLLTNTSSIMNYSF
jgi:bifunctional DNase/RNase